jgi:hypothetical protein
MVPVDHATNARVRQSSVARPFRRVDPNQTAILDRHPADRRYFVSFIMHYHARTRRVEINIDLPSAERQRAGQVWPLRRTRLRKQSSRLRVCSMRLVSNED